MNTDEHRWNELTERVIACVFDVSNELGCGFLESVYEKAMVVALRGATPDLCSSVFICG